MTTRPPIQPLDLSILPRGLGFVHPDICVERASGAEIWDSQNRQLIDFTGGIGTLNVGHRHPHVVAALERQLGRFIHTCFQVVPYEDYLELARRLARLVPGEMPKKAMFLTTGTEAVENAIKMARAHTRRPGILAFDGAFHGRSLLTMGLTGKMAPYKVGFGPFPADIFHAPFPVPALGVSEEDSLKGLERLFKSEIEACQVAAIIIEPVQGEGGFNIAPASFLRHLRQICDENGTAECHRRDSGARYGYPRSRLEDH
jgi:4-aminobutyrate aminotransferase/(S)-3-amino-2-methylpropionate transaminase